MVAVQAVTCLTPIPPPHPIPPICAIRLLRTGGMSRVQDQVDESSDEGDLDDEPDHVDGAAQGRVPQFGVASSSLCKFQRKFQSGIAPRVKQYTTCEQCGKTYTRANDLKKHVANEHEGVVHACSLCNKTYTMAH